MTKTRILAILVVVVVLLNAATLTFILIGKSHGPKHHGPMENGPRNIIIEKLNFDDEQTALYDGLIKKHYSAIVEKDSLMLVARNALYSQLITQDSTEVEMQLNAIGQLQKEVETVHFLHFQELKALCSEEQLPAFKKLTEELSVFFGSARPPHPKH